MSLAGARAGKDAVDSQLKQFIEVAANERRFQSLVHDLTDTCWDTCMERAAERLETKTKTCLVNCVERFIDTTNFITNRLHRVTLGARTHDDWE